MLSSSSRDGLGGAAENYLVLVHGKPEAMLSVISWPFWSELDFCLLSSVVFPLSSDLLLIAVYYLVALPPYLPCKRKTVLCSQRAV
jgi:hypothetical protein